MSSNNHRHIEYDFITEPTAKRRKVNVACNFCKAKKTKCDGIKPVCGPCSKRRGGFRTCVYRDTESNHSTLSPDPESTASRRDVDFYVEPPASYTTTPCSDGEKSSMLMPGESLIDASIGARFMRQISNAVEGTSAVQGDMAQSPSRLNRVLPRLPLSNEYRTFYKTLSISLPPRKEAEHLFQKYWEYIDPIYPWLDRPVMNQAFESLWSTERDINMNETAFHCILNLMFAISSSFGTCEAPGPEYHSAGVFYDRAHALMRVNLMDMYHVEILQALLLSAVYLQSINSPRRFFQTISLAIHVAGELGLYDPGTIASITSASDRWLAQGLWLGCIILDRIAAMTFGCPLKISQLTSKNAMMQIAKQSSPGSEASASIPFYLAFVDLHNVLGDVLEAFYKPGGSGRFSQRGSTFSSNNNGLSAQALADLFNIEASLCDWQAGLPSHLQIRQNHEDPRLANILHSRYLCVRLLLFRPFFFPGWKSDSSQSGSRSTFATQATNSIINDCRSKCIDAARDIIELIFSVSNTTSPASGARTLPSHWYIISYVYMSATVLTAAQLFPNTMTKPGIEDLLKQADKILHSCENYTNVVQKCRTALSQLNSKIQSRTGLDDSIQDEVPLISAGDETAQPEAGELSLEGFDFDETLSQWNGWPFSFDSMVDDTSSTNGFSIF